MVSRTKQTRWVLGAILLVLLSPPARADLEADLRAMLQDKALEKASVGVKVVELGADGKSVELARHGGDVPLIPASNQKLLTTSAVLDHFGPDFKFRTLLLKRGQDLILVGDGDPAFGDAELLKKAGWESTTVFQQWSRELAKAKAGSIGNVIVDDGIFDGTFVHPNWPADQLKYRYSAGVAGMTFNVGCVDFRIKGNGPGKPVSYVTNPPTRYLTVHNACIGGVRSAFDFSREKDSNQVILKGTCNGGGEGSVTVHDPALFAGTVLAEQLAAAGIKMEGKVVRDRTIRAGIAEKIEPPLVLLAVHETPLLQVLARADKESMNVYAESLCKRLGAAVSGESGSWENGTAAVGAFLKRIGVDEKQVRLDDGCGLSRHNHVSADAIVRVLEHNYYGKNRDSFLECLAVGGGDGTLEDRFHNELRGRVFAKSGYISGVSALSGYLRAKDDRWYAFSILMNGVRGGNAQAKSLQDNFVRAIDTAR